MWEFLQSFIFREVELHAKSNPEISETSLGGERIEGLKEFTMEEVQEHDTPDKKWVYQSIIKVRIFSIPSRLKILEYEEKR